MLNDLPADCVQWYQLDRVGSYDHHAVFTTTSQAPASDEEYQRVIWLWQQAYWKVARLALASTDWRTILNGDQKHNVSTFSSVLHTTQQQHVIHHTYSANHKDQHWFGYQLHVTAEQKYKTWARYKYISAIHYKTTRLCTGECAKQ